MRTEEFTRIVRDRLIRCEYILAPKGQEYSRGGDRLHNFKKAAEIEKCIPERSLVGMWMKHVVSVLDIVGDIENGKLPSDKLIDEKFSDVVNYPLLLEALIRERIDNATDK